MCSLLRMALVGGISELVMRDEEFESRQRLLNGACTGLDFSLVSICLLLLCGPACGYTFHWSNKHIPVAQAREVDLKLCRFVKYLNVPCSFIRSHRIVAG